MGSGPLWTAIIVGVILLSLAGLLYWDWANNPGAGHVRHPDDDHGPRTVEWLQRANPEHVVVPSPEPRHALLSHLGATEYTRRTEPVLVNDFRVPPYMRPEYQHLVRELVSTTR